MNYVENEFVIKTRALCRMWEGDALAAVAQDVLSQVEGGPAAFVATSTEGAALAAVCAAMRSDGSVWRRVNLMVPTPHLDHQVVFVEPVAMGAAWTAAVKSRYPASTIAVPRESRHYMAAASAAAAA